VGRAWPVLSAAAFLIGAVYQSRAALKSGRAIDQGDDLEALRQLAHWTWGYWLIFLLLILATWDMVIKLGQ
jgi:hypothetical protein